MSKKLLGKIILSSWLFVFCFFINVYAAEEKDKCSMGSIYNKYSPDFKIVSSSSDNEYLVKISLDSTVKSNIKFYYQHFKDGSSVVATKVYCSRNKTDFYEVNRENRKNYCYVDVKNPLYLKFKHKFDYNFYLYFRNTYYIGTGETYDFSNVEITQLVVDVEDPDCKCPSKCNNNHNDSSCKGDCKTYGKKTSTFEIDVENLDSFSPKIYDLSTDDDYFKFGGKYGSRIECNKSSYSTDFEEKFCKGYVKGSSSSVSKTLKCDYKNVYKESELEGDNYYKNVEYFYKESSKDIAVGQYIYKAAGRDDGENIICKRGCQESIEVKYGPPVTSKAGLCFEYKVKLVSRTNCYGELTGGAPTKYRLCTPAPLCTDGYGTYRTAGPNDSFDSCIKTCDGGKYTKKCSQKCYKQVYDISNNKTFSNNSDLVNVSKIVNDNGCSNGRDAEGTLFCDNNCTYCSSKGYGGYYSRLGSGFVWNGYDMSNYPGRIYSYWSNILGPQYFRSSNNKPLYYGGRWYSETGAWGLSGYTYNVPDSTGIYRAQEGGGYCQDRCWWYGCNDDYFYLNREDYDYEYNHNKKIYDDAKRACKASSVCTTSTDTETVKFNIKVKSSSGDIVFPSDEDDFIKVKKDGFVSDSRGNRNSTLLYESSASKSCYDSGTEYTNISRATWHLPGTYFNLKTGSILYNVDSTLSNQYFKYNNKFCTTVNEANVNRAWWNYYMNKYVDTTNDYFKNYDKQCIGIDSNYVSKYGSINNPKSINDLTISKWNIIAQAKDFGLFNWEFNIKCFYAVNDCFGDEGDNAEGYKIRTFDTSNMFPNEDGDKLTNTSSAGKTPPYNWSEASITEKNANYKINPVKLRNSIQQKSVSNRGIYSEEDLDYEFIITPSDFYKFRKSDANTRNYTNFSDEYMTPISDDKPSNGVLRYYSEFISNLAEEHNTKRPSKSSIICNNIASNGSCEK